MEVEDPPRGMDVWVVVVQMKADDVSLLEEYVPRALTDCVMCTGGEEYYSYMFLEFPIRPGNMGQLEDLMSECHISRGLLGISHKRF